MDSEYSQEELDNHSDQLDPNNDAYWTSRGYDGRPDDWDDEDWDNLGEGTLTIIMDGILSIPWTDGDERWVQIPSLVHFKKKKTVKDLSATIEDIFEVVTE